MFSLASAVILLLCCQREILNIDIIFLTVSDIIIFYDLLCDLFDPPHTRLVKYIFVQSRSKNKCSDNLFNS